jgi:hypothetical protein
MNDIVVKDFYKADVFRFDLEKQDHVVEMVISNSISWDSMKFRFTREELKGMADFLNKFLNT